MSGYNVTVIRRDGRERGYFKYKVLVECKAWQDYSYMIFRWNARRVAKKLIKEHEPKQDVVVQEFYLPTHEQ